MPRARPINQDQRQTAAASENGSGCFSVYWMPPLAALFIACVLAIFALKAPLHVKHEWRKVQGPMIESRCADGEMTNPFQQRAEPIPVADKPDF